MSDTTGSEVSTNTENEYVKKPMTLEDMDRAFSLAWRELFRQKRELEVLIDEKLGEHNELLKIIIEKIEKIEKRIDSIA